MIEVTHSYTTTQSRGGKEIYGNCVILTETDHSITIICKRRGKMTKHKYDIRIEEIKRC